MNSETGDSDLSGFEGHQPTLTHKGAKGMQGGN